MKHPDFCRLFDGNAILTRTQKYIILSNSQAPRQVTNQIGLGFIAFLIRSAYIHYPAEIYMYSIVCIYKCRGPELIIATYPMSQNLRGAPRLLFGQWMLLIG